MLRPRRHRTALVYWFAQGGRVVAWVLVLWIIVIGLQSCSGRLMFRPKPPLEKIPASQPKFVPSDQ